MGFEPIDVWAERIRAEPKAIDIVEGLIPAGSSYSVVGGRAGIGKSINMIKKSDIVLLVLDASETITTQDQQLAGLLRENTRSTIILVNKWDLVEKENTDEFKNNFKALIYPAFIYMIYD